jgi:hypothetical protein
LPHFSPLKATPNPIGETEMTAPEEYPREALEDTFTPYTAAEIAKLATEHPEAAKAILALFMKPGDRAELLKVLAPYRAPKGVDYAGHIPSDSL